MYFPTTCAALFWMLTLLCNFKMFLYSVSVNTCSLWKACRQPTADSNAHRCLANIGPQWARALGSVLSPAVIRCLQSQQLGEVKVVQANEVRTGARNTLLSLGWGDGCSSYIIFGSFRVHWGKCNVYSYLAFPASVKDHQLEGHESWATKRVCKSACGLSLLGGSLLEDLQQSGFIIQYTWTHLSPMTPGPIEFRLRIQGKRHSSQCWRF